MATFASVVYGIPDPIVSFGLLGFGSYFALGGFIYFSLCNTLTLWRFGAICLCLVTGAAQIVFGASSFAPVHGHKLLPVAIWLALAALIALSAWANGAVSRAFGRYAKIIRLVGLSTYPIYLLHDKIGMLAISRLGTSMWLTMAVVISTAFVVAGLIEPLLQGWLKQQMAAKRAALDY